MATAPLPPASLSPQPLAPTVADPRSTGLVHDKLNRGPHKIGIFVFAALFLVGIVYALSNLIFDVSRVHHPAGSAYLLLGVALLVALGFEFVNGFHTPQMPLRRSSTPIRSIRTWRWHCLDCAISSESYCRPAWSLSA